MQNAAVSLIPRGVYWARYTKKGRPVCYAVDSHGEIVRRYRVESDTRLEQAIQSLWEYLDVVDPKPQLRLVGAPPLPPTARQAPMTLDPYDLPPLPFGRRP
jgi:hypothetical protein